MTEEMAIELLAKYRWELKGYLVRTRINYKGPRGGIKDIDVLALHPVRKDCVIVSCKAWGSPEHYQVWYDTPSTRRSMREIVLDLTNDRALDKAHDVMGKRPDKAALVFPGELPPDLADFVRGQSKVPLELVPIHELLVELFAEVAYDMRERRKRYPDTALELIRWFDRSLVNGKLSLDRLKQEIEQGWSKKITKSETDEKVT